MSASPVARRRRDAILLEKRAYEEGLAEARREIVTGPSSRTTIKVVRIRISNAGQRALES
jgi:hypothetical protein